MEEHFIEVYTSPEESYQLTVRYYPSQMIRSATHWEPEEWSDEVIEGIYCEDDELTPEQIDVFPFSERDWTTVRKHKLY